MKKVADFDLYSLVEKKIRSSLSGVTGTIKNIHQPYDQEPYYSVDIKWDNGNKSDWVYIFLIKDFDVLE